jgi:hypothetical protein
VLSEAHDGALAELLLDLAERQVERLVITFRAFRAFHDGTLLVFSCDAAGATCDVRAFRGEAVGATYGRGMTTTCDAVRHRYLGDLGCCTHHPNDTPVT